MARTAIEGGSKFVPVNTSSPVVVDTAGWGKVTLLAAAETSVSVSVGATSAVGTTATTTVIDPMTGEAATKFPASGVLAYIGHSQYIKATGASVLLSEPRMSDQS